MFWDIYSVVQGNLNDYSTDQRGDVGSWLRISASVGLPKLLSRAALENRIPLPKRELVRQTSASLIRLSMERLENVRLSAYESILQVHKVAKELLNDIEA